MKTFHHKLGHAAMQLLTVAELREELAAYPDELLVAAAWEGQTMPLGFHLQVVEFHCGKVEEQSKVLLIDAE